MMHDMHDRGIIAPGKAADITIPRRSPRSRASRWPICRAAASRSSAVGIDHVIVNGTVLFESGELTDALPGQIVRGPLYRAQHAD